MDNMLKKTLALATIVLFIGLAVVPSIQANVVESELVDITVEVCGIGGAKPHTVQLTQEQAEELELLFDEINSKLDDVETREEAVKIINDVIIELDGYGLLGDTSIEEAQRLVTGVYSNPITTRFMERLDDRVIGTLNETENKLCLIVGKTDNTMFHGPLSLIFARLADYLIDSESYLLLLLGFGLFVVLHAILSDLATFAIPLSIGYSISYGRYVSIAPSDGVNHYASGWVKTLGINGAQEISGEQLKGNLPIQQYNLLFISPYMGTIGFTGIHFKLGSSYYLGSALMVNIEEV
jgi:hypothetical protein